MGNCTSSRTLSGKSKSSNRDQIKPFRIKSRRPPTHPHRWFLLLLLFVARPLAMASFRPPPLCTTILDWTIIRLPIAAIQGAITIVLGRLEWVVQDAVQDNYHAITAQWTELVHVRCCTRNFAPPELIINHLITNNSFSGEEDTVVAYTCSANIVLLYWKSFNRILHLSLLQ